MGIVAAVAVVSTLAPATSAQAGCGVLGLQKCPPPPSAPPAQAPDPGGDEHAVVPLPPPDGKLVGFSSQLYLWATSAQREVGYERAVHANTQRIGANWNGMQPTPASPPLPDEGGKPVGGLANQSGELGRLDEIYLELTRQGFTPIITLGDAPLWASDYAHCGLFDTACKKAAGASHIPPGGGHLGDWQRFAAAVARRYPRAAIQTWNEPNIKPFWGNTTPDPGRMEAVQCAAYSGIKAASPTSPVLGPGLAVFVAQRGDGSPLFETYLDSLYTRGLRSCMDDLSLNLYPANAMALGAGSPFAQEFEIVRRLRQRHGDSSPIWLTETGSTSFPNHGDQQWGLTEAQQADLNLRLYNKLATMSDVHAIVFHTLRNAPTAGWTGAWQEPGYNYGFLHEDFSPKAVFCAFAARADTAYAGC